MKLAVERLPATARRLVELIGFPATMALIRQFGGLDLPLSQGVRHDGRATFEAVAAVIGADAVRILAREYNRHRLPVPTCYSAMTAARDEQIVADYDALTKGGATDRAACQTLVRTYRTCERNIRRITKLGRRAGQVIDAAQLDLF